MLIGTATVDCKCKTQFAGEDPEDILIKKGSKLGIGCSHKLSVNSCLYDHLKSIDCPVQCSKIISQEKLKASDFLLELKHSEIEGRNDYKKRIPQKIYAPFTEKFPLWWPALINVGQNPHFIAKYKIRTEIYIYAPLKHEGKLVDVGIIYFFKSKEKALSNELSWSFWNHNSGELLFEGETPYKIEKDGYVEDPCFVPVGKNLDEILLSTLGKGSADTGWSGELYFLGNLKKDGPIEIKSRPGLKEKMGLISINDNLKQLIIHFCGRASGTTGKYSPELKVIESRANLHKEPSNKSELVGSCTKPSIVADMGSNSKGWNRVYCEGHLGWVHQTNLRNK